MVLTRVLFICLGNINRSAAAELIWKRDMHDDVRSSGFKGLGKPISKKMRDVLIGLNIKEEGVIKHKSQTVDLEMIRWSTVIFCMTAGHMKKLISMFPKYKDKIKLLPKFINKERISDPGFSTGIEHFKEVVSDITMAISLIKKQESKHKYPFVIITKGRAGHAPFIELLERIHVGYILTLEKEDIKYYTKAYKHIEDIIELEESNCGVGYSRSCTLKYMKKNHGDWFWKLDDDFTKFSQYNMGKNKFHQLSFLEFIKKGEKIIDYYKNKIDSLALVGYRQTPFGISKNPILVDARVIQFVAVNPVVLLENKINYDRRLIAMSDEDLLIRLYQKKLHTVKINHYMYTCPYSNCKNQVGGLDYRKTPKILFVKQLVKKHRNIVKIISDSGGLNKNPQYTIDWGKIKPPPPIKKIIDVEVEHPKKGESRSILELLKNRKKGL